MSDRGAYRSIARVLIDGPDFQRLSAPARHVFLTLKIGTGPTGIELRYPSALLEELGFQTGLSGTQIRKALGELEAANWIRRAHNLLWIVRQLDFEPSFSSGDAKHRASVRRHVLGLPRVALVAAFIDHYRAFLPDADALLQSYPTSVGHAMAPGRPSEGPSMAIPSRLEGASNGHRSTEDRGQKTEDRTPDKNTGAPEDAEFEEVLAIYPPRAGGNPPRAARAAYRARRQEGATHEAILAGTKRYREYCDREGLTGGKYVKQAATFFGPDRHFEEQYQASDPQPKMYGEDGVTHTPEFLGWCVRNGLWGG